ncbi:D-amino acid dehydrogenase small subunit-like protein [Trifolium pratense]|uniref:D-amino acid dehydrogenase small subunit-like protein n=1 Tax=Trifolium pratense TaxID=57577 RepID=A0A2K3MLR6_TRIPR|nr:D-amino acid dehydrogenase small subunit-like protein [Trifolium pratense]
MHRISSKEFSASCCSSNGSIGDTEEVIKSLDLEVYHYLINMAGIFVDDTQNTWESSIWDLSMRSHQLWTTMADNLQEQGLDPMMELGWKKTGIVAVSLSFYGTDACHLAAYKMYSGIMNEPISVQSRTSSGNEEELKRYFRQHFLTVESVFGLKFAKLRLIEPQFAKLSMLKVRAKQLSEAGLIAEYLSNSDLSKREPDLLVD